MTFLIMLSIYAGLLGFLFYVMRRAVGLPALAMVAGALLAKLWTSDLTLVVANTGFKLTTPPLASLVSAILILLPAAIVIVRSTKLHNNLERAYNSLIFAVLATALSYDAFAAAIVLDSASENILSSILPYSNLIITVCVVLAFINILSHHKHAAKPGRPRK